MDNNTAKEIFDHMFSFLETMETQSEATLLLLRAKGIITDEELAPHLDQAGNASSVRWRAARARLEYLLSAGKTGRAASEKKEPEKEQPKNDKQREGKPSESEPLQTGPWGAQKETKDADIASEKRSEIKTGQQPKPAEEKPKQEKPTQGTQQSESRETGSSRNRDENKENPSDTAGSPPDKSQKQSATSKK